ncbi:MAG: GyrI-like domain-containing protein [Armatimonadetes bacterium]|nr:GyrI-like domain-containing protein [Armatimonadota bacterium]
MTPRYVDHPGFRLVGRALTIRGDEAGTAVPAFWDRCIGEGIFETFARICGEEPPASYGLVDDADEVTGAWDYIIGVEADETTEVPEGWVARDYPARRYAVFAVEGPIPQAIQDAWAAILRNWLPNSGFVYDQCPSFERYTHEDPAALACEIWIPIRPVR